MNLTYFDYLPHMSKLHQCKSIFENEKDIKILKNMHRCGYLEN